MEIAESVPSSKVALKLDFVKPFEGHNTVDFTLVPQGDTTRRYLDHAGTFAVHHQSHPRVLNMDR